MTVELLLERTTLIEDGVFGRLSGRGLRLNQTLYTMEDDWKNNLPRISCIPAGAYRLRRTIYYKGGYETFEVTNVPNRTRILIHPANTEEDVEGCIGLGLRFGTLVVPVDEDTGERNKMKKAVVASREAFRRFMEAMKNVDTAELTVVWTNGLP